MQVNSNPMPRYGARDLRGDAVFRESWKAAAGALTQISAP